MARWGQSSATMSKAPVPHMEGLAYGRFQERKGTRDVWGCHTPDKAQDKFKRGVLLVVEVQADGNCRLRYDDCADMMGSTDDADCPSKEQLKHVHGGEDLR